MESRSSNETRKAHEETREARDICEKLRRDLHSATLETQGWKQEAVEAKAAVSPSRFPVPVCVLNSRIGHIIARTSRTEGIYIGIYSLKMGN